MTVIATPTGNLAVADSGDPFSRGFPENRWWAGPGLTNLVGYNSAITYAGLYRTQPWLAAAVNKVKNMIARLPLRSYEMGPDGRQAEVWDHPIARVFRCPNPVMSRFRFVEWMLGDLALYGNAVCAITTDSEGYPTALWPVPWPLIEIIGKRDPLVYVFHAPTGPIQFTQDKAVHLRFWNPAGYTAMSGIWSPSGSWSAPGGMHPLSGNSPVEPLRRTLMNEDAAARWATALFSNAGQVSGVVSTEKNLNKDQMDLMRKEVEGLYGGVDNAFRIAIMQAGMKWTPTQLNFIDAALMDLRKLNREEVAAAYDIPPPMLQILDKATFSNVTEQHRNLYQDSLPPWMVLFEEEFYTQLISRVPDSENIHLAFDLTEVLRGSPTERAAYYTVARRWMKIDEIRQASDNLPPLEDGKGDVVMVPINEFPIGETPPPDARPPVMTLMNALDRAERYASAHIGAGLNGFQAGRFARELIADLGRDDPPVKFWADSVAAHVAQAITTSSTVAELHGAIGQLKAAVQEPPEEPNVEDLLAMAQLDYVKAKTEAARRALTS